MPRGNGRGPDGMGPLTGRGLGNCRSLNIARVNLLLSDACLGGMEGVIFADNHRLT